MELSDAIDAFLCSCRFSKNLSNLTISAYRCDLEQFRRFAGQRGAQTAAAVSGELIQGFVAHLKGEQRCLDSSIRRKVAVLKSFVKHLEINGHLAINPFSKIRMTFRHDRRLPKVLSREQIKAMLETAKIDCNAHNSRSRDFVVRRNYALLELLFYSGARIGEILRLDSRDLDQNFEFVTLKGKGRKERIVHIGCKPVVDAIKSYLAARRRLDTGVSALFLNARGNRLTAYSAESIVRTCAKAACIAVRVTPHMFRHTMATMMLENGADLRSIQEILGHASISTTEIYTHVSAAQKRQVMRAFHPRVQFGRCRFA